MSKIFKWASFAYNDTAIKTAVHFFPFAGSISATYPVELVLSIFGNDFETVEIKMEGARLSQPDGLILDQVFPALLSNYQGFYGVSLQLKCPQHAQMDLSNSICQTELLAPDRVIRFNAKLVSATTNSDLNGICRSSKEVNSSLVALNIADVVYNNGLPAGLVKSDHKTGNQLLAGSVQELLFSEDYLKSGATQITSQGELTFNNFHLQPPSSDIVYFYIERSRNNSLLQQVQSL